MRLAAVLTVSLLSITPAFAGVVMTVQEEGKATEEKVYLEADRARMTSEDGVAIFRADRKVMWMLDDSDKSYVEVTPETAKKMNEALGGMRQQMDEMLKSMPPEQRRMMEQQMGQMAKPVTPAAVKSVYRKTGRSATVGKWRCEEVEHLLDGKKDEDICATRLSDLGLARGDIAVMYELEKFMTSMIGTAFNTGKGNGEWEFDAVGKALGYDAMPVRWRDAGGKTTVLKSIERGTAPAGSFELPRGYKKQDMEMPKP